MDLTQTEGMDEVLAAVGLLQSGNGAGAKAELNRLWGSTVGASPAVRSIVAHFLADLQETPEAELELDLAALEAATGHRDACARDPLTAEIAGFLPSLHLNAGDAYRRLGQADRALDHARTGLSLVHLLGEDNGYARTVIAGLERLADRCTS